MTEDSRSLRLAIAGLLSFKLVINMVVRAIYPFLPAIARGLGISLAQAGALVSIRWGASLTTPFLVGVIGRRRSPSALMVIGGFTFSVGALVTAAAGVYVGAIVGFVLLGVAKPLFDIGSQTWIAERVPFERRARAIGFVEIAWAGGLLVGAPLFGWLIDRFGWAAPFWFLGVSTMFGSILLASTRLGGDPAPSLVRRSRLRLDGTAIAFLGASTLMSASVELAFVVLGEWLEAGFGLTLLALGGVGTVLGLAELAAEGGVLAFTDRLGSRRAMQIATIGMVIGFTTFAFLTASVMFGVAAFTFTLLAFEFGIVSAIPLATELRPDDRMRFLAVYLVVTAVGRIVADLVGPQLFSGGGMQTIAWWGAGLAAASFVVISRWVGSPQGAMAS